eukprot:1924948-Pyramimonas_sp.AAC.1
MAMGPQIVAKQRRQRKEERQSGWLELELVELAEPASEARLLSDLVDWAPDSSSSSSSLSEPPT